LRRKDNIEEKGLGRGERVRLRRKDKVEEKG